MALYFHVFCVELTSRRTACSVMYQIDFPFVLLGNGQEYEGQLTLADSAEHAAPIGEEYKEKIYVNSAQNTWKYNAMTTFVNK